MYFAKYFFRIRIYDSYSLKDKRKVTKSIVSKIQNKYHISVAEVDDQDIYNSLCLACAMVSNNIGLLENTFYGIRKNIEANYQVDIYESYYEVY